MPRALLCRVLSRGSWPAGTLLRIARHNRVAVIESLPGSPVTSEGKAIMTRRVRGPLDGPLLPYGPGFEAALTGQGYSADSIGRHLRLMVHLSRWLAEQHLAAGDLTARCARRFLRFRRAQGHRHPASMAGMAPLLDYLGRAGAAPAAEPQAAGPVDALIADYRRYLLQERGLSPQSSVPHYADVARRFVAHVRAGTPGELRGLTAAAVTGFVLSVSRRRSAGEAKAVSTRLRSFLRYLELEGLTRPGLLAAVPSVAGRAPGLRDPDRLGAARAARRRGRRAAAGGHRLAGRGDRRARQGRPARPAAADAGGRRGDRRVAARWPAALCQRRGLHPHPGPPSWPVRPGRLGGGAPGLHPGGPASDGFPPAAPHGRDADAAGRRHPDRGGPSAAAAQPGRYQPVCQG